MHTSTLSASTPPPVGDLLRHWRQRRRLSQLELAGSAEVSTRHLSYVETGRAQPSRAMLLRLAERLQVPLRERNQLLTAAGFAPMFRQHALDDPALVAARQAVDLVLAGHEPYPALAVDRRWNLLAHNRVVPLLLAGLPAELLAPPVNVLRLSLHPQGLAPRIDNLGEWHAHLFARLARDIELSADEGLVALRDELRGYPAPPETTAAERPGVIVPLRLRQPDGSVLSFISTTTVFGTPLDITVAELAIESFFPADEQTAAALRAAMG